MQIVPHSAYILGARAWVDSGGGLAGATFFDGVGNKLASAGVRVTATSAGGSVQGSFVAPPGAYFAAVWAGSWAGGGTLHVTSLSFGPQLSGPLYVDCSVRWRNLSTVGPGMVRHAGVRSRKPAMPAMLTAVSLTPSAERQLSAGRQRRVDERRRSHLPAVHAGPVVCLLNQAALPTGDCAPTRKAPCPGHGGELAALPRRRGGQHVRVGAAALHRRDQAQPGADHHGGRAGRRLPLLRALPAAASRAPPWTSTVSCAWPPR